MSHETATFAYETQPLTVHGQHIEKRKRKCHGNRKLQYFKQKYRACGITGEQIDALIQTRHDTISE